MHLEAESHVSIHHSKLVDSFYLLKGVSLDILSTIFVLQERLRDRDLEAVLRVWQVNSQRLQCTLHVVGLHQARIWTVRLEHRSWDLALLSCKHHIRHIVRVVSFHFIFISTVVLNFPSINFLKTVIHSILEKV